MVLQWLHYKNNSLQQVHMKKQNKTNKKKYQLNWLQKLDPVGHDCRWFGPFAWQQRIRGMPPASRAVALKPLIVSDHLGSPSLSNNQPAEATVNPVCFFGKKTVEINIYFFLQS